MDKDSLIRLREQLTLVIESGTSEVPADLVRDLAAALGPSSPGPAGDSAADGLEGALQALEAAWLQGAPAPPELPGTPEQQIRLAGLITNMLEAEGFALAMSKGDLSPTLRAKGLMPGGLKALQANLRHLTWQTQMIARGDLSQRVDFMGEFSEHFNAMVSGLKTARDQLIEANQDMESFIYSASHDLRSPLRAMAGFARMLTEDYGPRLDAEGLRLLQVISDNARLLSQLINDLLAFARSGRQEMKKASIDMAGLTRSIAEELRVWAPERHYHLNINHLPPTHGDRSLIHQVLVNLLTNAVKFTAPKDGLIEVGGVSEGDENIYFVKDNGVGFDMQQAAGLFGVFQRLHGPAEFEGSGVGLAIVKRIIERHGGRVWAEGKINEGAAFYFSLPKPAG
jgi:signal transduction histidine kinase